MRLSCHPAPQSKNKYQDDNPGDLDEAEDESVSELHIIDEGGKGSESRLFCRTRIREFKPESMFFPGIDLRLLNLGHRKRLCLRPGSRTSSRSEAIDREMFRYVCFVNSIH